MAIYFPATRVAYSEWYTRFADTPAFQPAVNDWDDFLKALYNLGESISSNYNSEASVLAWITVCNKPAASVILATTGLHQNNTGPTTAGLPAAPPARLPGSAGLARTLLA